MKRAASLFLWCLTLTLGLPIPVRADFDAYLKKPEPDYKWEKRAEKKSEGGTIYDLHLVSQKWQGIVWEHRVQIFYPDQPEFPRFAILFNTGGSGSSEVDLLGMLVAKMAGIPFVVLWNIPNQPLFNGLTEDALIVYTWQKFMESGDESWPLHFPMAKAVLKCMDAVGAFTKEAGLEPLENFVITGGSKRGWTTWLVGASKDQRVKGIAPMVIDTLNLPAQIPHHLASYGKPSEQISDYTTAGMLEKLNTKEGKRLVELEDPYSYRDRLTMPKLIINATNDRYWALDALNLYWDGLKGPKWVLYVPNNGHGLEQDILQLTGSRVIRTITAFARCLARQTTLPKMEWEYKETEKGLELILTSEVAPKSVSLFKATAPTKDFRDSKWSSELMSRRDGQWVGVLERPTEGFAACFGEATYEIDGKSFTLSTQIRIMGKKPTGT